MADQGDHGDATGVYLSGAKGPPKPPRPPPPTARIGLTEVERAMSVLEGRHPEHEKLRRQTREGIEKRRGEIAIELARKSRNRWLRRFGIVIGLVAAGFAGTAGWRAVARTRALQAAIDASEAPWIDRGFTPEASNVLTASRTLDADLAAAGCFVATTTADGPIHATEGGTSVNGPRSVAWCTCGPDHVTLDVPPSTTPAGLSVLRIDAAVLGGPWARSWLAFKPGAWSDGGHECAEAMLDAWIDAHPPPHPDPDTAWLDSDPARAPLRRAGLKAVAAVEPAHPFAVVKATAGACLVAIARAPETLALRAPGGARLIAGAQGALAWCSAKAATLTVWRDGTSPVAVLSAPAARIGGRLGVRETAEAAGVPISTGATWLRDDDLPWDAAALLAASGVSKLETSSLVAEPGPLDARVVALALSPGAGVVAGPDRVVLACDPSLTQLTQIAPTAPFDALCAPAAPVAWFNKKEHPAGLARGTLPVWLSPLEGRHEPDAVARIPELLALTRRLAREGFEATALEGVTELPDGVRIIGRAAEDAIVAIGLAPKAPWVLPYSNGVPWDLGDAPRVVPLKPGETVKLVSSPPTSAPLNTRRTVVFRRSVVPP